MPEFAEWKVKFMSVVLGIGLASVFRQVCKDDRCRVVKGPNLKELDQHMYRIDDKCYKYRPSATMCDA